MQEPRARQLVPREPVHRPVEATPRFPWLPCCEHCLPSREARSWELLKLGPLLLSYAEFRFSSLGVRSACVPVTCTRQHSTAAQLHCCCLWSHYRGSWLGSPCSRALAADSWLQLVFVRLLLSMPCVCVPS